MNPIVKWDGMNSKNITVFVSSIKSLSFVAGIFWHAYISMYSFVTQIEVYYLTNKYGMLQLK